MHARFSDLQDEANPFNGTVINDSQMLSRILNDCQTRKPFIAKLESDNGYELTFGIGRSIGCVQHCRSDGMPPYLMAVGSNLILVEKYSTFLCGNTPTEIPARYILPAESLAEIIEHFCKTGDRISTVSWEQI
jgi:hypothetical protein